MQIIRDLILSWRIVKVNNEFCKITKEFISNRLMFMMHLTIGDFDSLKQRHDSAAFNLSRLNDNLKRMKAIYEESSSDLKEQLTKILIPMMNTVEESLVMVEYMNCIRTKLNSGPCRVEINVIKIEDEVKESK